MTISYASIPTKHAHQYLAGFHGDCSEKPRAAFDGAHAHMLLPEGVCEFEATEEFLDVTLIAQSNYGTALLEDVVSNRLDRMTTEDLPYHWIQAPEPQVQTASPRRGFASLFRSLAMGAA
jgi:hypothetical protein